MIEVDAGTTQSYNNANDMLSGHYCFYSGANCEMLNTIKKKSTISDVKLTMTPSETNSASPVSI